MEAPGALLASFYFFFLLMLGSLAYLASYILYSPFLNGLLSTHRKSCPFKDLRAREIAGFQDDSISSIR